MTDPKPAATQRKTGPSGPSVATQLVKLAEKSYELGCCPDGEPYAIPKHGPRIVRLLRGGRHSLRAELASAYFRAAGSAASQSALADACMVLDGRANRVDPVELYLRVAEHRGSLVLDLGDASGRCVVVTSAGWQVVDNPPVRFRRTALTGVLPDPISGGDFSELWTAVNIAERYRPVLLAVLVAELMPALPHPVVLLTGEQGTAKTTTTSRLASIVDPSPVQVRKAPRDAEAWTTAAAGSWVVALDNLSDVQEWLSDSLCRASTGDGDVRRLLYSNGDLHVVAFRRCVFVNGIDLGAARGDLADRLVHLALERISGARRRKEQDLASEWREAHPKVLGALLDLTVEVLAVLPSIKLDELPRMADFGLILAAVDQLNKTDGLGTYYGLRDELAEDAATSDPVLVKIREYVRDEWEGTSAELLAKITPLQGEDGHAWKSPKDWPANARALTTILTRQAPTLRQLGWTANKLDKSTDPRGKAVRWKLIPASEAKQDAGDDQPSPAAGQRRGANDGADAATRQDIVFSQVNQGANGAANGAAFVPQDEHDAAHHPANHDHAATGMRRGTDAAHVAAPTAQPLTSTNGDHAATAASGASFPHHLCPPTTAEERPVDTWRVSGQPIPGRSR
jgi:hypothetical protein